MSTGQVTFSRRPNTLVPCSFNDLLFSLFGQTPATGAGRCVCSINCAYFHTCHKLNRYWLSSSLASIVPPNLRSSPQVIPPVSTYIALVHHSPSHSLS